MKPISTLAFCTCLAMTVPAGAVDGTTDILARMTTSMGPTERWQAARYASFTLHEIKDGRYLSRRHLLSDRTTGRYRVEDRPVGGPVTVVLAPEGEGSGKAYRDSLPLESPASNRALDQAEQTHGLARILFELPWRWLGDRHAVSNASPEARADVEAYVVNFELGGGAPVSVRATVSGDPPLITSTVIAGETLAAGVWEWIYVERGGLMLPRARREVDGRSTIFTTVTASPRIGDETVFEDPDRMLLRRR